MRLPLLLAAVAVASLGSVQPGAAAYQGPWCAHRLLGGGFVENNCQMMTYEQCRANIFATGGAWCTQNPWYVPPAGPAKRKTKRRK